MSLIGDIFGTVGNWFGGRRQRAHEDAMLEDQQAFQREMAQMGVQWRVQDAINAGVHPVYALGGAFPSGAPIAIGGGSNAGEEYSKMGQAVGNLLDPDLREKVKLELELLKSQIGENDARASYYSSQAARLGQNQNLTPAPSWNAPVGSGGSAPYVPVGEPGTYQLEPGANAALPGAADVVKVLPSQQTSVESGRPWLEASVQAGSKRYRLSRNMEVLLPAANDIGEALEPLSESVIMLWTWYRLNVNEYGPHFTDLAFQELGLPDALLRAVKGFSGWQDYLNEKGPSVRYTGPGNPYLPKLPRMLSEEYRR